MSLSPLWQFRGLRARCTKPCIPAALRHSSGNKFERVRRSCGRTTLVQRCQKAGCSSHVHQARHRRQPRSPAAPADRQILCLLRGISGWKPTLKQEDGSGIAPSRARAAGLQNCCYVLGYDRRRSGRAGPTGDRDAIQNEPRTRREKVPVQTCKEHRFVREQLQDIPFRGHWSVCGPSLSALVRRIAARGV